MGLSVSSVEKYFRQAIFACQVHLREHEGLPIPDEVSRSADAGRPGMKTIVEFPDQGVVVEEAAEWLIRLDADMPPSRQELRALSDWLHRSPAHREELDNPSPFGAA